MAAPLKILIAPLDWGLGHATRCIPVIRYLQQEGHHIFIAAEGAAAQLLAENFPALPRLPLEGYRIRYSKNKHAFTAKIISQVPRILKAIRKEHQWLMQQQAQHRFDLIISDNRYGLYHPEVSCVILTHQLQIRSGKGPFADAILRRMHYRMLRRFQACWVVDEEKEDGLSGKLAHPVILPAHASYIGVLSQFAGHTMITGQQEPGHIVLLLSGPEPMRGQLEVLALQQAALLKQYTFTVVAGNPSGNIPKELPQHIQYYTHLDARLLLPVLQRAALVVCRSGYSTVMDLAVLGKKALLIPTPGQTEQEYLAGYLAGKNYFSSVTQDMLRLERDIPAALSSGAMPVKPVAFADTSAFLIAGFLDKITGQTAISQVAVPGTPG